MTQIEETNAIRLFQRTIQGIKDSTTWASLPKRPEYEQAFIKLIEAESWLAHVNTQYLPAVGVKIEFS